MNQLSEKRFELTEINPSVNPLDTVCFIIDYENPSKNIRNLKDCVDCLNEQSERIKSLEMELDLIANTKLFSRRKLEEENKQMKKQLEQIPKSIREVWLE